MVGPADHPLEPQAVRFARFGESVHNTRSAAPWRIGVDELDSCLDATAARDVLADLLDFSQYGITTRFVDVANIHLHPHAAGNAVDSAGENVAYADGSYGIARAARSCARLYCQRDLSGREKRIVAIRHQHRACMPALAFNGYLEAGRRGDRGDNPQRHVALFENRSLFDVHFNESRIVSPRQAHR